MEANENEVKTTKKKLTILRQNIPEEYKTTKEVYHLLNYGSDTSMRHAISKSKVLDDLPVYRPEGTKEYFFKIHEVLEFKDNFYRELMEASKGTIGELKRSNNAEAVKRAEEEREDYLSI